MAVAVSLNKRLGIFFAQTRSTGRCTPRAEESKKEVTDAVPVKTSCSFRNLLANVAEADKPLATGGCVTSLRVCGVECFQPKCIP